MGRMRDVTPASPSIDVFNLLRSILQRIMRIQINPNPRPISSRKAAGRNGMQDERHKSTADKFRHSFRHASIAAEKRREGKGRMTTADPAREREPGRERERERET